MASNSVVRKRIRSKSADERLNKSSIVDDTKDPEEPDTHIESIESTPLDDPHEHRAGQSMCSGLDIVLQFSQPWRQVVFEQLQESLLVVSGAWKTR
jgi:hypothetical protein